MQTYVKIYSKDARWTKKYLNRSLYCLTRFLYRLTHFYHHWWVVDEIKLASATGKYILSGAG